MFVKFTSTQSDTTRLIYVGIGTHLVEVFYPYIALCTSKQCWELECVTNKLSTFMHREMDERLFERL